MFSPSRGPERLVRIAQWLIALLFAFFLIQVGGSLLADLPSLSRAPARDTFLQAPPIPALVAQLKPLEEERQRLQERQQALRQREEVARQAYESAKAGFDTWRAARAATEQASHNQEVIARARQLDLLLQQRERLRSDQRRMEEQLKALADRTTPLDQQLAERRQRAEQRYQRARAQAEWQVFGLRLLLVGPLLAGSIWQFRRYRRSEQWPFVWGILLFGLVAFFVELAPYLPSFGAYIRYGVGALLTLGAGRALIRWFDDYQRRMRLEQGAPQDQRQRRIRYETALRSLARGQCPSCERPVPTKDDQLPNFCMHCGLALRTPCPQCHTPHLSFFPYCPSCGQRRGAEDA